MESALQVLLSPEEYARHLPQLEKAAERVRMRLPRRIGPATDDAAPHPEAKPYYRLTDDNVPENRFYYNVARRCLRLFLSAYVLSNAVLNGAQGLRIRKPWLQFIKDLKLTASFKAGISLALYSFVYRVLRRKVQQSLWRLSARIDAHMVNYPRTRAGKNRVKLASKVTKLPIVAPFVAGAVATLTFLVHGQQSWYSTVSYELSARAVMSLFRAASHYRLVPVHEYLIRVRYTLGAVGNGILFYFFVFNPSVVPGVYRCIMSILSEPYVCRPPPFVPAQWTWPTQRTVIDSVALAAKHRYPAFLSRVLRPQRATEFDLPGLPAEMGPVLSLVHPEHKRLATALLSPSMASLFYQYEFPFWNQFASFCRINGALAILAFLLKYRDLSKDPEGSVYKLANWALRLSAVLSLVPYTSWILTDIFQSQLPKTFLPTQRFFLQGFLGALWIAILPRHWGSFRFATSVAFYGVKYGTSATWRALVSSGRIKPIPYGEFIPWSLSMGTLMVLYEVNPQSISNTLYLGGLSALAGPSIANRKKGQEEAKSREEKRAK